MILQVSQLVQPQEEAGDVLSFADGVFALILFFLSIYAWKLRRQPRLIIVASAFLLYFLKEVIELFGEVYGFDPGRLPLTLMNFAILALFFMAIVVHPRTKQVLPTEQI